MMDVVFVLLAKGAFFDVIQGVNSKSFPLVLLECFRPHFFHKHSVIDLWLITFTISRTIRETTGFYPLLRCFHFLYCYMKCC